MIPQVSMRPRHPAVALVLSLLRRGADSIALAAAVVAGLVFEELLEGHSRPEGALLAAQAFLWLGGLVFLRWLWPSGQRFQLGRAISGFALILTAALAAVLAVSAALSKGVPAPSAAVSLILTVPSLAVSSALAVPAVVVGRRLSFVPEALRPTHDERGRRQEEALSIVFHELRRPLAALVSASELVLDTTNPEEERVQLLQIIHRQAVQLNDFLEEILEAARIQSGQLRLNLRRIDLRHPVKEWCEEFAEAHRSHDLRLIGGKQPLPVAADPAKLRMVLGNLVANAVAYSPSGSTVTVRLFREKDTVGLQVEDEGPGVPEPYRQQIFEQFFRIPGTSERGFGLGLYIARQLIEAHGGAIGVDGRAARGSCFTVALPALRTSGLGASTSSVSGASSPRSAHPSRATPGRTDPPSRADRRELPTETAKQ